MAVVDRPARPRRQCGTAVLKRMALALTLGLSFGSHATAQIVLEAGGILPVLTPESVAIADFNNDGDQDLVVASLVGNSLEVYYGNGDGSLSPPLSHTTNTPYHVFCHDLDEDGNVDLVSSNSVDSSFSVLMGDGTGHFSEVVTHDVGGSPMAAVAGDFDEDGTVDLAIANFGLGVIQVADGDGSGGFAAATTVALMEAASFVVTLDLNQDQHLDLVVTSGNQSSFGIFFGDGSGGFAIYQHIDIGVDDSLWDVAVRDVNGDLLLDLVIPCPNQDLIVVYEGSPFGGVSDAQMFSAGITPEAIELLDVDGDGHSDAVTANSASGDLCVNVGNSSGQFASPVGSVIGVSTSSLSFGDLDNDGRDDFVVANDTGFVQVVLNKSISIDVTQFVRGDSDGDGTLGVGDAILCLGHIFAGQPVTCSDAIDADDDGSKGLTDAIVILNTVFGTSSALTGLCTADFTDDFLPLCFDAGICGL